MLSNNRISALWAKHIDDPEQKEQFQRTILASTAALDRLKELLDEMIQEIDYKAADFETPNWPYYQASLIGEKRTLQKIRRLITFDK